MSWQMGDTVNTLMILDFFCQAFSKRYVFLYLNCIIPELQILNCGVLQNHKNKKNKFLRQLDTSMIQKQFDCLFTAPDMSSVWRDLSQNIGKGLTFSIKVHINYVTINYTKNSSNLPYQEYQNPVQSPFLLFRKTITTIRRVFIQIDKWQTHEAHSPKPLTSSLMLSNNFPYLKYRRKV